MVDTCLWAKHECYNAGALVVARIQLRSTIESDVTESGDAGQERKGEMLCTCSHSVLELHEERLGRYGSNRIDVNIKDYLKIPSSLLSCLSLAASFQGYSVLIELGGGLTFVFYKQH